MAAVLAVFQARALVELWVCALLEGGVLARKSTRIVPPRFGATSADAGCTTSSAFIVVTDLSPCVFSLHHVAPPLTPAPSIPAHVLEDLPSISACAPEVFLLHPRLHSEGQGESAGRAAEAGSGIWTRPSTQRTYATTSIPSTLGTCLPTSVRPGVMPLPSGAGQGDAEGPHEPARHADDSHGVDDCGLLRLRLLAAVRLCQDAHPEDEARRCRQDAVLWLRRLLPPGEQHPPLRTAWFCVSAESVCQPADHSGPRAPHTPLGA